MEINNPIPIVDIESIIAFLSEIELFKKLNEAALRDLATSLIPMTIAGGTTLIQQGDLDTTMYILYRGRLRVLARAEDTSSDKEQFIAEISIGQIVGEIALLTHLPRTTTVRAVRDSILLKIDEATFNQLEKKYTAEVVEIAKLALRRLATKPRSIQIGENVTSIVIAPSGNSDHAPFCQLLAKELNKIKPTLLITKNSCNQHFGKDIANASFEESNSIKITNWVQSLENQYGYVIYETDHELSPWTQRCIRQADRLTLVAEHSTSPKLNEIERSLFTGTKKILPYIEMIFIHPDNQGQIYGTANWLTPRFCHNFQHFRLGVKSDIEKFIRFLTSKAFGVVLNGGGARGITHLGAIKALEELNIPIDFIAGTSAGAAAAGGYSSCGISKTIENCKKYSKNFRWGWTLPIMSLLNGKYYTASLKENYGNNHIEDLWTRFFCVSTNLTENKLTIHDSGPTWLAIRASTSIPGVYPPIYDMNGNLLVDGGVINNMPVDIMRKMICGGKILAVNCFSDSSGLEKRKINQSWISGWKLFFQKFNPYLKEKLEYENIINIIMASFNLSSDSKQKQMASEADYLLEFKTNKYSLLDFKPVDELFELGYRTSKEKLPGILGLPKTDKFIKASENHL